MYNKLNVQWRIQTLRWGGGGDTEGAGLQKKFFPPFRPQFGSKNKGGRVPRAPPLDLPVMFLAAPISIYFIDSCISALLTLKTILFVDN